MSTRCNVLVKDKYSEQWFYRHCDGYRSVTAESLKVFVGWLVEGKIRPNVSQGASWLIILGNNEYAKDDMASNEPENSFTGWKVGAYEVTDGQHGDIDFLYKIDMAEKTVSITKIHQNTEEKYTFEEFLETDFSRLH